MTRAYGQNKIGVQRLNRSLEVACVLRMLDRDAAQVVPARCHSGAKTLSYRGHCRLSASLPDAVASVDQWTLGLVQGDSDSLDVVVGRVARHDRGGAALDNLRANRSGTEHGVIYGQVDRPHWRRGRDSYCTLYCRGEALRLYNSPVLLGHRSCYGRGAKAVAQVQADPVGEAASVPCERNDNHRQASPPHVDELAHALGKACSEVDDHDAGVGSHLRVPTGHRRDGALMKSQDAVDVRVRV